MLSVVTCKSLAQFFNGQLWHCAANDDVAVRTDGAQSPDEPRAAIYAK